MVWGRKAVINAYLLENINNNNNNWICIVALTGYAIQKLLNIIITPAQAKHCDIP